MLKKIKKIKNLGIFSDYAWTRDLPEFKRFNVFYWWNGSWKTTLTKLFGAFESWSHAEYPSLEYQIETTDEGDKREGQPLLRQIRIFNQSYVDHNIGSFGGDIKPIFVLGEENIKLADKLKEDEGTHDKKNKEYADGKKEIERVEKIRGDKFSAIATVISSISSWNAARAYRKPNAEVKFSTIATKQFLNQEELNKYLLVSKQTKADFLDKIEVASIDDDSEVDFLEELSGLLADWGLLLKKTVESEVIEHLRNNPKVSEWVEQGLEIHSAETTESCEFCGQILSESRLQILAKHFSQADRKIKEDIESLLTKLKKTYSVVRGVNPIDKANFYADLRSEYVEYVERFNEAKTTLLANIESFWKALSAKKLKTTEAMDTALSFSAEDFVSSLNVMNEIIDQHNKKTLNFSSEIQGAVDKLEVHYLSTIYDEVIELNKTISDLSTANEKLNIEIMNLGEEILKNRSSISSSHIACDKLNKALCTFLWRSEISFQVRWDGYAILRDGKICRNLSEWEKTAIAFIYFIIHLQDSTFKLSDWIVVIDDPISSLDSNFLFQAFSFLKVSVKSACQIFLFTHNYDFLKLLLNWLKHDWTESKSYFMIKNSAGDDGMRIARIDKLDPLLCHYESEYQYLFKQLANYRSDGTLEKAYNIPNIARKVLDTFLMIQVPNNAAVYAKLSRISFDESKKAAIYKFVNDQSHITGWGFDPSLVPETEKVVQYLFEMIEQVAPEHYGILNELTS